VALLKVKAQNPGPTKIILFFNFGQTHEKSGVKIFEVHIDITLVNLLISEYNISMS
jgi:hypothetical protein